MAKLVEDDERLGVNRDYSRQGEIKLFFVNGANRYEIEQMDSDFLETQIL